MVSRYYYQPRVNNQHSYIYIQFLLTNKFSISYDQYRFLLHRFTIHFTPKSHYRIRYWIILLYRQLPLQYFFGKMNLNVYLPPSYTCKVYDYEKVGRKNIQRCIKSCDWAKLFINLTINERAELLSNTLIDIFRIYIPNKKLKRK